MLQLVLRFAKRIVSFLIEAGDEFLQFSRDDEKEIEMWLEEFSWSKEEDDVKTEASS